MVLTLAQGFPRLQFMVEMNIGIADAHGHQTERQEDEEVGIDHHFLLEDGQIDHTEYGKKKTARNGYDAGGSSMVYVFFFVIHYAFTFFKTTAERAGI